MAGPANHLAFVCPRFAEGVTVGGAERLLRNLADRAACAGRRVSFLSTCARDHFTWRNELAPGTRRVGSLEVTFFPVDEGRDVETFLRLQDAISRGRPLSRSDQESWLRNSVNSTALCEHLRTHAAEYDRIIAGPYLFGLTYFASQILPHKTLLVPCLHDEPFAYQSVLGEMFRVVAGCMFNSEPERDLARRLHGIEPARCAVVGMGLDPFEADAEAFALRHALGAPYIVYCGRREPLKGTPLLLDYFAAFRARTGRELKLVLTGSGQFELPPDLEGHVLDVGVVSEQEKQQAMAGAVCFCHPSVNESFGIVILESWLARTPALVHGCGEVLRWQCGRSNGGLWFRNYPEFEEELALLLDNDALCDQLATAGRAYVLREYAWDAIDRKMSDALARLGRA